MLQTSSIVELNNKQVIEVSGGVAPILSGLLWGFGYIGAIEGAARFGAGLGSGFYDATHRQLR